MLRIVIILEVPILIQPQEGQAIRSQERSSDLPAIAPPHLIVYFFHGLIVASFVSIIFLLTEECLYSILQEEIYKVAVIVHE